MKICIAGWYFRPRFLQMVRDSGYESIVIAHRDGPTQGIPSIVYDNVGLEFGCYRKYVEHHWDGESDVLFLHDDAEVSDTSAFASIESLAERGVEQAYIFQDETHELINGGAHGRGIWICGDTLKMLAADFPADLANTGVNIGMTAQKGIFMFHEQIMKCGRNTGVIAIVPQFRFAHRGRLHEEMFVYRKTAAVPGGLVNVSQ